MVFFFRLAETFHHQCKSKVPTIVEYSPYTDHDNNLREPLRARLYKIISPADQGAVARRAAALGAAQPTTPAGGHGGFCNSLLLSAHPM